MSLERGGEATEGEQKGRKKSRRESYARIRVIKGFLAGRSNQVCQNVMDKVNEMKTGTRPRVIFDSGSVCRGMQRNI